MQNGVPLQVTPDNAHIPDILDLIRRAFAYMDARVDPPSSAHRLTLDAIKEQTTSGEVWIIGAPPLACVFLTEKNDHLYVGKLAVDPFARGKGHARRLIEVAEARAKARGLTGLELEVRIELIENHEAFRRMGFVKTGEKRHEGFDRPTSITMRKAI